MNLLKYMYGKENILSDLIEGKGHLRLCDIRHYKRIENLKIKDFEDSKTYKYNPKNIKLKINDKEIKPDSFASDIIIKQPTRPCYCICFSNKKDDEYMYEKFEADICIEFNLSLLIDFLKTIFPENQGCIIEHRNVTYYEKNPILNMTDSFNSVFMKHSSYKKEDEYRLAVFLPYDGETVLNTYNKKVGLLRECKCKPNELDKCQCYFIFIDNGLDKKFLNYISNVYKKSK